MILLQQIMYGNVFMNPLTTDMITTGEIEDVNFFDNYYNKIVKRDRKSVFQCMIFIHLLKRKLITENLRIKEFIRYICWKRW